MTKYLLLLLVFPLFSNTLHSASFERDIAKIQSFIEKENPRQAVSKLKSMKDAKDLSEEEKKEVLVYLALAYRLNEQPKEALATLQTISGKKPDNYYLELAESYLATSQFENAIMTSKNYDSKNSEGKLCFVKSLWVSARSHFELKQYLKCINCCKKIIQSNPFAGASSSKVDEATAKQLAALKSDAKELMKKAQELYDILNYGKDFAWYRKAREAEFEKDYEEALKCYNMIKKGTLKNAARCYTGHCLDKTGKSKEALKTYMQFADEQPYGFYTGEALWHAAALTYREMSNKKQTEQASALIKRLKKWLIEVQDTDRIKELLEEINPKLKADIIDKMDPNYLAKNACGNLIRTKQYPENITNRFTSPWYFKELTVKTYLLSGFLLGEAGMKAQAAVEYKTADKIGAKTIIADQGAYPALLTALLKETYLLPIHCTKKLSPKNFNKISMACFFFCADKKDLGEELFDRYLNPLLQKKRNDQASLLLGKAYCLLHDKKWKEAEKVLKRLSLDRKLSRLPTRNRADYLLACMYAKSDIKKSLDIFKRISEQKDNDLAPNALLAMAIASVNVGMRNNAIKICTELRLRYPATPFADAALTLRKALKNSGEGEIAVVVETQKGKLITHRRTIVIPGATAWDIPTEGLKSGDIILYNIKCVGNGPCKIVKGVGMSLSSHEPQPPKAKGDRIIFVRAPILYVNNLTYNFKDKIPELKDEPEIPLQLQ